MRLPRWLRSFFRPEPAPADFGAVVDATLRAHAPQLVDNVWKHSALMDRLSDPYTVLSIVQQDARGVWRDQRGRFAERPVFG
jgi:hypothetical protein